MKILIKQKIIKTYKNIRFLFKKNKICNKKNIKIISFKKIIYV